MKVHGASFWFFIVSFFGITALPTTCFPETPGNVKSPESVREVLEKEITVANAAWWGFDKHDSTDALQSAINSGAKRVIIPNMVDDWIVRPIKLASNQELIFEDGVVVTAKNGEAIQVYTGFKKPIQNPGDVSILFENCRITSKRGGGIYIGFKDNGLNGYVEFRDCVIYNTEGCGLKIEDKSINRARVRFVNCIWRNTLKTKDYDGALSPLWINHDDPESAKILVV